MLIRHPHRESAVIHYVSSQYLTWPRRARNQEVHGMMIHTNLGENRNDLLYTLECRWNKDLGLDKEVVLKFAKKYGKYWVKKYFNHLGGSR